jgi:hypothetical protein
MARFEDRVAQYILAVLYSHYHMDVSLHKIPEKVKPSKISQAGQEMIGESKRRGAATLAPYTQGFTNPNVVMPANPDIGLAHHKLGDTTDDYKASEVYENTVACILRADTLYFAVNFKVRRNTDESSFNKFQAFTYSNFGDISESAMDDIKIALRVELADTKLGAEYKFTKLAFVAPVTMPTNQNDSAAFHAEMQLVAYFKYALTKNMSGWYIGVNKPCCSNCTPALQELSVGFDGSHVLQVTNWKMPSSLQAMLKKSYDL